MTKLSTSIMMLQKDSEFVKKYNEGISKEDYWLHTYEDVINIIAKLPEICCLIYANTFDKSRLLQNPNPDYVKRTKLKLSNFIRNKEMAKFYTEQ